MYKNNLFHHLVISDDNYVHLNVITVVCIMNNSCKLEYVSYAQVTLSCYLNYESCLYVKSHATVFDHQIW
jgi:hypothetical protein